MRVRRTPNPPRRGVQAVEAAIVLPVVMMLTLGTCSTAMGVYYYQLVATLAREGARYASVHGTQYAADTGNPPATAADIYNNAILPMAVGLTPESPDLLGDLEHDQLGSTPRTQFDPPGPCIIASASRSRTSGRPICT